MKLMELSHTEILWEDEHITVYISECLNEARAVRVGSYTSAGGMVKKSLQTIGKFAKNHPYITGALAGYAADGIRKYKKNKRNTIKFYTQDIEEKKLYKDIVKQLMATGKYRKEKETFIDGGYLFVLKKLG